ncbi:MAG: ISKra4 family transposase [Betaproteobacteria bacterium]|nr:ISKra4 family transposase [Betaproteobacteria bacterium]
MKMIIEAHLVDDVGQTERIELATISCELTTDPLGMSLAEGKALLSHVQQYLVKLQCQSIASAHAHCDQCNARLTMKGWHTRQIRTVFGTITVRSPRVRHCRCMEKAPGASFSPLARVVPTSVTPELEYLQAKWAAHLSYATATRLLSETLPIADAISVSGAKRRVRAVATALEQTFAHPEKQETELQQPSWLPPITALAVDSGWLKHCDPPHHQGRHVNLVVGRTCFEGGETRLYGYVHNQVPSAANRLDLFLSACGVSQTERVTIFTDGAAEFEKAVKGSLRPMCRILDWFHIAMKFRAIEQTALKDPGLQAPNGRSMRDELASCKWLVWHGKARKAVARLMRMHDAFGLVPEERFRTLSWNLRQTFWYLRTNDRYLVNYARRRNKKLPISSAIAESAVNEVVGWRMAKKRQMRWSDEGAHLLAQVRVCELNGELRPRAFAFPQRQPRPANDPKWDGYLMLTAAA